MLRRNVFKLSLHTTHGQVVKPRLLNQREGLSGIRHHFEKYSIKVLKKMSVVVYRYSDAVAKFGGNTLKSREDFETKLQASIHDLFIKGITDGAATKIFANIGKVFGVLVGVDQGSTSENLMAIVQEFFGWQLQAMIWSLLVLSWLSVGWIVGLLSPFEFSSQKLGLFMAIFSVGVTIFYLLMSKAGQLLHEDTKKYIKKCLKTKELTAISEYYGNNKEKPFNNFFLAFCGEELVGQVALDQWLYPGDKGEDGPFRDLHEQSATSPIMLEVRRMSVKTGHRGKGIANLLLNAMLDYAKEKTVDYIILKTSSMQYTARRLYSRFGFKLVKISVIFPPLNLFHFILKVKQ